MSTLERLYESLLLDNKDQLARAELLALLKSNVPETRWAAYDILLAFELLPGLVSRKVKVG